MEFEIKYEREVGEKSMKMLQKQVKELDKRWEGIVEKSDKAFKSDGLLGDICQIAVYIEHAICAFTFPEVFNNDTDRGSLCSLLNLLNGDDQNLLVPLDPRSVKAHGDKGFSLHAGVGFYIHDDIIEKSPREHMLGGICCASTMILPNQNCFRS